MTNLYFPNLQENSFLHSTDALAMAGVKKLKGLDILINAMNKISYEKIFRIQSMGDDIKITKKTCGDIYNKVEYCAKVLDMPIPDVFINQSPFINAFTTGTDAPMIQIYSGIIDFMDDQELLAVIAHEMGHIKCGHVLYHTAAYALQLGAGILGPLKIFADATFALTLLEWERKSELSADRASLLVTQDIQPVIKVLMKMAGGSEKIANKIDYDDFIKQSNEYKKISGNLAGMTFKTYLNLLRSHPFPVMRAAEINNWAASYEYKSILKKGVEIENIEFNNIPSNLKTDNSKARSIKLEWNAPLFFNIAAYDIFRRKDSEEHFKKIHTVNGRKTTVFIDKNLEDNTEYLYYLNSVDVYGNKSSQSEFISATTKDKPMPIENFYAVESQVRKIEILWQVYNLPPTAMINIYRSAASEKKYKRIAAVDSSITKYIDSNLKDGISYCYYLVVENETLLSTPTETIIAKTKPLINAPVELISTYDTTLDVVELKWQEVREAIFYNIYSERFMFEKKIGTTFDCRFLINIKLKKGQKMGFYVKAVDEFQRESLNSEISLIHGNDDI